MIYPSIDEITKGKYNRYTLVIATAKCARIVTDEYVEQRELAEKVLANNKDSDKTIASMIKREIRDEKAVKTAIKRLYAGEYAITEMPEQVDVKLAEEALRAEKAAAEAEATAAHTAVLGGLFGTDDTDEDEENREDELDELDEEDEEEDDDRDTDDEDEE